MESAAFAVALVSALEQWPKDGVPVKDMSNCDLNGDGIVGFSATKAGFRQLGDCPIIVGAFVWLYLDREDRHEEIQTKLRKARVVT